MGSDNCLFARKMHSFSRTTFQSRGQLFVPANKTCLRINCHFPVIKRKTWTAKLYGYEILEIICSRGNFYRSDGQLFVPTEKGSFPWTIIRLQIIMVIVFKYVSTFYYSVTGIVQSIPPCLSIFLVHIHTHN